MGVSIRLEFDRSDRTYETGEIVRGFLRITPRSGATLREVRMSHSWETRGLGNVDRGFPSTAIPLSPHTFSVDSTFSVPFHFPAPKGPIAYHGHAFELVHFVLVEADFSGDRGISLTEEFLVVPGPLLGPPPNVKDGRHLSFGESLVHGKGPSNRSQLARAILPSFLKRQVSELRLGTVRASVSPQVTVTGGSLDTKIRIAPKKTMRIDGAFVELRAREVWASGTVAQANRTTDQHQVYSKVTPIPVPRTLEPGSLTNFGVTTTIPDQGLYSFVLEEHALAWEAVVRVDIPLWPDWERVFPLLVWPKEGLEHPEAEEATEITEGPATVDAPEITEVPDTAEGPESPEPQEIDESPETSPDERGLDLAEAVRTIKGEEIIGGRRDQLIKNLMGKEVSFDFTVTRVDRTFTMYSDPAYRNGRTISGYVSGEEVRVLYPEDQNEAAQAHEPGSVHSVTGTVAGFDRLSLRPMIRVGRARETAKETP